MNRSQVAMKVRENKDRHPEQYCSASGCLWAMRSGKCPKHPNAPINMGRVVVDDGAGELDLPEYDPDEDARFEAADAAYDSQVEDSL